MQISGEWYLCDDDIRRPVIRGEVQNRRGGWEEVLFLVDTGADQTVFSAGILELLDLAQITSSHRLEGLGGRVGFVAVETTIHLFQTQGNEISFRGHFAAVTEPEALDMSVLGRDITGLFAAIVDRPGDVVCLVGQRHRYAIIED